MITAALQTALSPIVDASSVRPRESGGYAISNYAPDSSEYGGDTQPGSAWEWIDDDLVIEWVGTEEAQS